MLNLDQKFYFVSLSGDKCVGSFRDVVRLTFSWRTLRIAVAFMWLFAIVDLHGYGAQLSFLARGTVWTVVLMMYLPLNLAVIFLTAALVDRYHRLRSNGTANVYITICGFITVSANTYLNVYLFHWLGVNPDASIVIVASEIVPNFVSYCVMEIVFIADVIKDIKEDGTIYLTPQATAEALVLGENSYAIDDIEYVVADGRFIEIHQKSGLSCRELGYMRDVEHRVPAHIGGYVTAVIG